MRLATPPQARAEPAYQPVPETADFPLGVARGQVAKTYIVAEAQDGLVLVDQHAAHERLVLERMRRAMAQGGVASQALLLPEVVELDEPACDRLETAMRRLGTGDIGGRRRHLGAERFKLCRGRGKQRLVAIDKADLRRAVRDHQLRRCEPEAGRAADDDNRLVLHGIDLAISGCAVTLVCYHLYDKF